MLTAAAIVTLILGTWGILGVFLDLREDRQRGRAPTPCTRAGDLVWLLAGACMATTAAHSLAASWF